MIERKIAMRRRELLAGIGASAVLPLLHSGRARAASYPKRFFFLMSPNGVLDDKWWPKGAGSDFTLPEMTSSLEPYKGDIVILNGVQLRCFMDDKPRAFGNEEPSAGGSHDDGPALITGRKLLRFAAGDCVASGPSLDQYIADGLIANGIQTPVRTLTLGARTMTGKSHQVIHRAADSAVTPENNPANVYKSIFAGKMLGNSADADRIKAENKSILDFVSHDLEALSKYVGTDDKAKLAAHMASVRDLETQLDGLGAVTCSTPAAPPTLSTNSVDFAKTIKAQLDLSVKAMACDLTRVVSMQMSDCFGTVPTDFLGGKFAENSPSGDFGKVHNTHEIAHHGGDEPDLKIGVEQFFVSQLAYLIGELKKVPEGSGTLLDNTVVLYMNQAHNGGAHSTDNMPIVLAGRCGGTLTTGRYLTFPKVPTNGLLAAIANMMDVKTTTFGDPVYGGELAGIRTGA
jgi:hypothetical protein